MNDIAREPRPAWRRRRLAARGHPWPLWLGALFVAWISEGVSAGSGTGYLPLLGPTPIRFELAVARLPVALPPPALIEPAPEPSTPSEPLSDAQSSSTSPETLLPVVPSGDLNRAPKPTELGLSHTPAVESHALMGTTNVVQLVLPDMLLRYFMEGAATNREPSNLAVPFSPALPPLPSSRASYTSGPPQ